MDPIPRSRWWRSIPNPSWPIPFASTPASQPPSTTARPSTTCSRSHHRSFVSLSSVANSAPTRSNIAVVAAVAASSDCWRDTKK